MSTSIDVKHLIGLHAVREARLYKRLGNRTQCLTCERRCIIRNGEKGFCGTRINIGGKIYTMLYGDISSVSVNPIEKKPFFHFKPGSYAITIGSWGCNFTCPWCQNYEISKNPPRLSEEGYVEPKALINMALKEHCNGTSISFNEPTLQLEYSLDLFRLAKHQGLYNTFVSNGYMTNEALKTLQHAGLDAVKIDVKGGFDSVKKYCGADIEKVWRNIGFAKKLGLHVEIVFLMIPRVNDNASTIDDVCTRLKEIDLEIPLHFTRYHPNYMMTDRPGTPIKTIEKAVETAFKSGLKYVYVGNVPGHRYENTYCPECGSLLIERRGFSVIRSLLTQDKCPQCDLRIPIIGPVKTSTIIE